MAEKFIEWDGTAGRYKQNEGLTTSAGAGDSGKIVALDGSGKLDTSLMPVGIGAATISVVTSENLSAGDFVNLYDNGGTINARKADASNGRKAHGFVLAGVTSPAAATVYYGDVNTGVSGLTVGAEYFLSDSTAGGVVTPAPTGAGELVQRVGVARSATELFVDIEETPLELA